jgi:hypothetical protein
MRIREENCNMVLLAVVTLFSAAVAGGVSLLAPMEKMTAYFADRASPRADQAPSPDKRIIDKRIIYVSDQPAVRVIGAPFVPNTNPRER